MTINRVKHVPTNERGTTTVREVACPLDETPVVASDDELADLLPRMAGCSDGRALVVEEGRLVRIVSPTDVMRRLEIAELRGPRHDKHI